MYEHRLPGIQSCSGTIKKNSDHQFHCGRVVSLVKIVLLRVEHLLVILTSPSILKHFKIWGVQFFLVTLVIVLFCPEHHPNKPKDKNALFIYLHNHSNFLLGIL